MCVTKRESSETEALVEYDERELINNIHIDRHKYPPSTAISSRISHTQKFTVDTTDSCQLQDSRLSLIHFFFPKEMAKY